MGLTQKQYQHMAMLAREFNQRMLAKYEAGAKKHGGHIWDQTMLSLVDNAIEEAIDQFVYLMTLRDKLTLTGHEYARAESEYEVRPVQAERGPEPQAGGLADNPTATLTLQSLEKRITNLEHSLYKCKNVVQGPGLR